MDLRVGSVTKQPTIRAIQAVAQHVQWVNILPYLSAAMGLFSARLAPRGDISTTPGERVAAISGVRVIREPTQLLGALHLKIHGVLTAQATYCLHFVLLSISIVRVHMLISTVSVSKAARCASRYTARSAVVPLVHQ